MVCHEPVYLRGIEAAYLRPSWIMGGTADEDEETVSKADRKKTQEITIYICCLLAFCNIVLCRLVSS